MSKPFPPPPFVQARSQEPSSAPGPFGPPTLDHNIVEDERLNDDDVQLIFKQFLRPDQIDKPALLLFILRYCDCRNVAQAGRESGLAQANYWRHRPEVHACIEAVTARAVIKYGYDGHDVIERAKEITNIDPIVLQNPDGSYKKHLSDIPAEARRAIKKLKVKNLFGEDVNGMRTVVGEIIEVEFWDKMKGLELLGPEKNVFKKTTVVQHDVTSNMKDILLESGKRAEERLALMARDVSKGETNGEVSGESKASDSGEGWSGDGVPVGDGGS